MKKFEIDPSHMPVRDRTGPLCLLVFALAARIDAHEFKIQFLDKLVFDIPQTIWFFGHLESVIHSQSIHSNVQSQ
ncbi:hypothetical protein BGW80DRAFT_1366218, partial [Lactifluus volemus]